LDREANYSSNEYEHVPIPRVQIPGLFFGCLIQAFGGKRGITWESINEKEVIGSMGRSKGSVRPDQCIKPRNPEPLIDSEAQDPIS
jgi:hypothetical protein